jgi:hypothetical protein
MTVFLATVTTFCLLGWRWAGALKGTKLAGARGVLSVAALVALGAICIIWSAKPRGGLNSGKERRGTSFSGRNSSRRVRLAERE